MENMPSDRLVVVVKAYDVSVADSSIIYRTIIKKETVNGLDKYSTQDKAYVDDGTTITQKSVLFTSGGKKIYLFAGGEDEGDRKAHEMSYFDEIVPTINFTK